MSTLRDTVRQVTQALQTVSESARLDAELLIAQALKLPRSHFITEPDLELDATQLDRIQPLVKRRAHGEPIAYILGSKHFWDLELIVTPDTLIPRPETELLVEAALMLYPPEQSVEVIDLGTGSGAIAIAIAKARPAWRVTATEISPTALHVARQNAERYAVTNLRFVQGDWFNALPADEKFNLVISNPPYIASADPHLQQGDVRFEPPHALQAGIDGLVDIRILLEQARSYLHPAGWCLLEHGYDQGPQVQQLFVENGYTNVQQKHDLAGHIRMTRGQYNRE